MVICYHAPSRRAPALLPRGGAPLSDLQAGRSSPLPGEGLARAWNTLQREQNPVLGMQAPLNAFLMATGAGRCRLDPRGPEEGPTLAGSPALPGEAHAWPSLRKADLFVLICCLSP